MTTSDIEKSTSDSVGHRVPRGRLLGVDVVRALAIIGVFVMHFSMTGWLHAGPRGETPAFLRWLDAETSSRAMSLFVLLAGVSVALMTGGSRPYQGRRWGTACLRVAVRAVVLLLISLCIGEFGPSVLEFYAVLLVFLLPFTRLRPRTLFALSAVSVPLATLYPIWVFTDRPEWMMADLPEGLAVLTHPAQWGEYVFSLVFAGGGFQTVYGVPLVLAGLAIGRLDLYDRAVRLRMAVTGAGIAVAACLVSWVALYPLGAAETIDAAQPPAMPWQALLAMPGPRSLYATSAVGVTFMIGVALLLLGVLLNLAERPGWRTALWPLAAAGGMTMTWYAGHIVYQSLTGKPESYSAVYLLAVVTVTLVTSVLWRRWLRRGPLEWLVHAVITTVVPSRPRPVNATVTT
ncbi:heparan-alpha-glucosaminide N-acetyltransferase domain-containing protein [Amycolatopsis suaedae]|uniref:DUF418 domain-containing protein n=1 Tax=Amycolatopsis suaedae TaxID=2510978 RepID=A0A4Q7JD04_9PSEU|nr:heparan-alpha-glucosaminide N-acetyltransferase domain-containing protein [Amycolatopsis suaedae]RZQ65790.1 DUF418 domain-containing protein [Amycolatopsis suaedae]